MKFASTSLLLTVLVSSTACAEEKIVQAQLFIGTPWKIAAVGADKAFANGVGTLSLAPEGRLSAFSGCNGIGASYRYEGNTLTVGPAMATRMACMPEKKMQDEQTLGDALAKGPFTVKESPSGATLTAADGTEIVLVPVDDGAGDPATAQDEAVRR